MVSLFCARRVVLYVNDIRAKKGVRYDMADDGALANGRVFIDTNCDSGPGNPDGMKIDV
jgi:sugar lactone lactonase YvrE